MKTLKYIIEDPLVWTNEQDNEWGMHPYWVDEYRESDLESNPRSTLLYEETELNARFTQTLMPITSLGETDCP